jgi:CRP-like cAMP-binding protein
MATASNCLIELLPQPARRSLLALCEPVDLVLSQTLCEPGTPTQHVYFPSEGFISLLALNDGHAALEVGMVGREGMLGVCNWC